MSKNEDVVGNWVKVSVLGSGGFGIVSLWKNKSDEKTVALKICRDGADNFMSHKRKERWTNEVDIMRRLSHPNVVKAIPIPDDLMVLQSNLPILCMEYCKKGDLRKVLNLPENCSGLQEPEVRNLLRDVKSAIEFLHKNKIIHRDLKPENIVLQEMSSGEIVYKLIDLGYAKELDQNSLCSSFVGTLQYLAPELFTPQAYTCSVDYWSFGLVCHEVITGFRPFLPNMAPVSWMTHVKQKTPGDICIYQNSDGLIEYSQQLFPENHISQCLRYEFEKWLCLSLEWDGNKRGRSYDNSLIIFSSLDAILNKKIVTLFSAVSYEKLSYEVDNSTAISTLQLWVERDTKQPMSDQLLLLPNGEKLTVEKLAHECWDPNCHDAMVYIFSIKGLELPSVSPKLPPLVVQMLELPKQLRPYYYLRRAWPNAVYFIYSQLSLYQTFLEAYSLKMLSIILTHQELTKADQALANDLQQIFAKQKLNDDSLEYDIKCFNKIQFGPEVGNLISEWKEKVKLCAGKIQQIKELGEKLGSKIVIVTKKLAVVQSYQEPGQYYCDRLKTLLDVGHKTFDNLRRTPTDARDMKSNSVDMVKVVYNCLKERDRMLRDHAFTSHLKDINCCEMEINSLLPPLNALRHHAAKCNVDITRCQLLRQKDIWQLVFNFKSENILGNLNVEDVVENKSVQSPAKPQTGEEEPSSKLQKVLSDLQTPSCIAGHISFSVKNSTELTINDHKAILDGSTTEDQNISKVTDDKLANLTQDTKTMIYENQNLRYALQDCMTQSYQKYKNIIEESSILDKELTHFLGK